MTTPKTNKYLEDSLENRIKEQQKVIAALATEYNAQEEKLEKLLSLQGEVEVITRRLNKL